MRNFEVTYMYTHTTKLFYNLKMAINKDTRTQEYNNKHTAYLFCLFVLFVSKKMVQVIVIFEE